MVDVDMLKQAVAVTGSSTHAVVEESAHDGASNSAIAAIDARLRAVEQLIKIFRLERYIYLSISVASFAILVAFSVYMFVQNDNQGRNYLFGLLFAVPSGAMLYMGAAFLKMWSQALQALSGKVSDQ